MTLSVIRRSLIVRLVGMSLLLLLRHRDNIKRLLSGEEGRVGGKPKP